MAVESKVFPLYEVANGEKWTINVRPKREVPVREYLKLQGRFSHLTEEDVEFIQENVDRGGKGWWAGRVSEVDGTVRPLFDFASRSCYNCGR